jgi:hypothetical protein
MTRIEEIFFEAFELGIQNKMYDTVSKMVGSGDYKYVELRQIYEIAFEKEKKVLINNNLYEQTNSSEVYQPRA